MAPWRYDGAPALYDDIRPYMASYMDGPVDLINAERVVALQLDYVRSSYDCASPHPPLHVPQSPKNDTIEHGNRGAGTPNLATHGEA